MNTRLYNARILTMDGSCELTEGEIWVENDRITYVGKSKTEEEIARGIREAKVYSDGRKAKSFFRYGLEIVTEFLLRDRNDHGIPAPAFLINT